MKKTYVRFERGRDDIVGPTFGPYDFVQLTYRYLRAVTEGGQDILLGHYNASDNEWWPEGTEKNERVDFSSCHNVNWQCEGEDTEGEKALEIWYSDIIIYSEEKEEA